MPSSVKAQLAAIEKAIGLGPDDHDRKELLRVLAIVESGVKGHVDDRWVAVDVQAETNRRVAEAMRTCLEVAEVQGNAAALLWAQNLHHQRHSGLILRDCIRPVEQRCIHVYKVLQAEVDDDDVD